MLQALKKIQQRIKNAFWMSAGLTNVILTFLFWMCIILLPVWLMVWVIYMIV